jgi:biopolymer transport protein ExbD
VGEAPTVFDVWFITANTVYRGVPYQVTADWVQQGRLAPTDRIRPGGAKQWITVQDYPLLADYLPQPKTFPTVSVDDQESSRSSAAGMPTVPVSSEIPVSSGIVASPNHISAEGMIPRDAEELFERSEAPLFRRTDDDEEVDMVPLIDISMVLLVFFIMIRATGALAPVDVPEMRYAGTLATDPEAVTIVIDKYNEERIYYAVRHGTAAPKPSHDLLPTYEAALRALDEILATVSRPPEVRVACHKDLPYERIVELQPELEARYKKNQINSFVATVVEAPRE